MVGCMDQGSNRVATLVPHKLERSDPVVYHDWVAMISDEVVDPLAVPFGRRHPLLRHVDRYRLKRFTCLPQTIDDNGPDPIHIGGVIARTNHRTPPDTDGIRPLVVVGGHHKDVVETKTSRLGPY